MAAFVKEDGTPVNLTPEQEKLYEAQTQGSVWAKEDGSSFNPFQEFSSDQLFSLATEDPDNFQLVPEFRRNRHLWSDQRVIDKVADSLDKVKARGFEPEDLPRVVEKAIPTAFEVGKGLGKNLWTLFKPVLTPGGATAEAARLATGNKDLELQRERLEAAAGMETAVGGLSRLVTDKLPGKIIRIAEEKLEIERTPEQKISDLWTEVGYIETEEAAATGKGPFLTAVGGELVKETPPDPEEIATRAAGDPFTFYLFGKGFKGVHKAGAAIVPKAVKTSAASAGAKFVAGAPGVVGRGLAGLGPVVEFGEKIVSPVARGAGALIKAVTPSGAGGAGAGALIGGLSGGLSGGLGGAVVGGLVVPAVRAIGRGLSKVKPVVGKGMVNVGEQMAKEAPLASSVAQLGIDLAQTVPGAIAKTAEGTAIDIAFAAATSESPQDTQGIGLGTIFGLLGGARRVGGRVLSGQLIAPRAWGVKGEVASSGKIPVLDVMHKEAFDLAPEGVKERLNTLRQLLKGAAPNADLFLTKDTESMKAALLELGVSEKQATEWSNQEGIFSKNLGGRKVSIVKNIDSAPHEAKHIIQDALGESANRVVDNLIKDAYKDRWEQEGQSYANKLLGKDVGSAWRDVILDFTGEGHAAAIEKISLTAESNLREVLGREPTFLEVKQEVEGAWKNALTKAKTENPQFSEQAIAENAWRGILDAKEVTAVSDRYLARELAAENFDAAFKNFGGALEEGGQGLLPKLARIVAKTVQAFGGEPLEGRVSEGLETPLKLDVVEAVTKVARGLKPTIEPKVRRGRLPPLMPSDKRKKGAAPPLPPEEIPAPEAAPVAKVSKEILEQASETPPAPGAQSPKEILERVAESMASGQGLRYKYFGAKGGGGPASVIDPDVKRAVRRFEVDKARNLPDDLRALFDRMGFPYDVVTSPKGVVQILDWSPEIIASNAFRWAKALSKLPENHPIRQKLTYEIDPKTGEWTENSWRQIFTDAETFSRNQLAGFTGAGESLVIPRGVIEKGFREPKRTGEPAEPLPQGHADFINILYSIKPPKSGLVGRGKPLAYAGQKIAEAAGRQPPEVISKFRGKRAENLGIAGEYIREVNPLRAEMEVALKAAKIEIPDTIEAVRNLNLDRIYRVEAEPLLPKTAGGNTLTLTAGFLPKKLPIEIEGPDGKKYKATFDGYWDLRSLNGGYVPSITALENMPGADGFVKNSSGMATGLEKAGYKLPPLPPTPKEE